MKHPHLLLMLTLALWGWTHPARAQQKLPSRSATKTAIWKFKLPDHQDLGPMNLTVNFEYFFFREKWNGKTYAGLNMKVTRYDIATVDGTPAFKYKGAMWTGNELSACDGASDAFTGFRDIKILGISFEAGVTGGKTAGKVSYDDDFPSNSQVVEIDDDADLNHLNIMWAGAITKSIDFTNSFNLQARIDNCLKLTKNREAYKDVIKEADAAFNSKSWKDARAKYTRAAQLLERERYPKDQIAKIDKILAAEKAQTAQKEDEASGSKNTGSTAYKKPATATGGAGATATGNDDYWNTGKKANTGSSSGETEGRQAGIPKDAPPMVIDNAGNYYVQNENGKYVKTTKENYDQVKRQYNDARNKPAMDAYKAQKAAADQQALDKFYASQNKFTDDMNARQAKYENDSRLMSNSFYAAQAKKEVRSGMQQNATLSGTFESLEALEQAYSEQRASISQAQEQLVNAGRDHVAASMDYAFKDANANTAAFKGLATALGNLASDAAAEREAREARQRLEAERRRQEQLIKERKRQAILSMRHELIKKCPDGGVPLSFHKVTANNLYFFSYVLEPAAVDTESPVISVSNVYLVQRYSDGSWPFKNAILNELKKASGAKGNVVMVGYYTNEQEVKKLHTAFIDIAGKSEMTVKPFTYKGKKSSGTAGGNLADYWKDGQSRPQNTPQQASPAAGSEDDYWKPRNSAKQDSVKPVKKAKEEDYWK